MDWKYWIVLVPAVIQAVVAILQFFGITASSVKIPTSTTIVMTVLMLLTWLGVALNYRLRRSSKVTPALSASLPRAEELRKAELARNLLRMAENDSRNMWQRIHAFWGGVSTDAHLDAVNPYVDLKVDFVNATVFEVSPDHIEGRISYLNDPLRDAPEFLDLTKGNHGEGFRVTLRQWLLLETARQMSQNLPATLKTGHVAVFFRYIDQNGEAKFRYAFPDEIFRIEPQQLPTKAPPKQEEGDPIPLSRSVHVSAITVDFQRLPAESLLDISIMAVTSALDPISIDRHIDGVLRAFWEVPKGHERQDWLLTLKPQILESESQLDHLLRGTEFRIRLLQPIAAGKANDIWAAFCGYKKIDLSFANLSIWLSRDGQETQKERLPLWDGIKCWKLSDGNVFQSRVLNASAVIAIEAARLSLT